MQALARAAGGDTAGAEAYLKGAVRAAKDTGVPSVLVLALGQQTLLALARGDWGEGQALAEQASLVLREAGLEHSMAAPLLFALQARMALHRLDPDGARRALVSAQRRRHLLNYAVPYLAVQVRIELTRSYLDLADLAGAGTLLRETGELLSRRPDLGPLIGQAQALRQRLAADRAAQSAEQDAGTPERHVLASGPSALTAAELRLLPLLSAHLPFPEIAAELGRSPARSDPRRRPSTASSARPAAARPSPAPASSASWTAKRVTSLSHDVHLTTCCHIDVVPGVDMVPGRLTPSSSRPRITRYEQGAAQGKPGPAVAVGAVGRARARVRDHLGAARPQRGHV